MLDPSSVAFLEGGCALIVATVTPDGEPVVARGWGLTITTTDPLTARLLLAADDPRPVALLRDGAPVSFTGTDVATLHSLQLKGRCVAVEPGTESDAQRAARYADAFIADVVRVDRYERAVLERMLPAGYVAATVTVDAVFDQTPGPGAGKPMVLQ